MVYNPAETDETFAKRKGATGPYDPVKLDEPLENTAITQGNGSTGPGSLAEPSPSVEESGPGDLNQPLLNYDPDKPVMSGPLRTEDVTGTSLEEEATRAYGKNSLAVQAARKAEEEKYAGKGTLFSDIGARAAEGAAFDKAMELVSPDVAYKQDLAKGAEGYKQNIGLGEQRFSQQQKLNEQMNKYDVDTQKRMQEFGIINEQMKNDFTKELDEMNYSQEMESTLLTYMQNALTAGNTMLTQLAMSGEATAAEVDKIQQSIKNSLTTYSNIWKGSANSEDSFDFSNIA